MSISIPIEYDPKIWACDRDFNIMSAVCHRPNKTIIMISIDGVNECFLWTYRVDTLFSIVDTGQYFSEFFTFSEAWSMAQKLRTFLLESSEEIVYFMERNEK